MDERVYTVSVCPDCLTQRGEDESPNVCPHCDGRNETVRVRFRVSRSQVLKQADPHRSLVERSLYFGCWNQAGHYYWQRGRGGQPYRDRATYDLGDATPWGRSIDSSAHSEGRQGEAHVHHKDGWTLLAFADRSVDHRGGSWSGYVIPATLDGIEALAIAREAFPPIFARYTFDVVLVT